jgi:hypothetical protein
MASNQCFENAMTSVCNDRAVIFGIPAILFWVGLEAVVESSSVSMSVNIFDGGGCHHLAQVPEFHCLVFAVGQYVSAVALAVDVCESFSVAHESTSFPPIAHRPSIPDPQRCIVGSRVQNMWR